MTCFSKNIYLLTLFFIYFTNIYKNIIDYGIAIDTHLQIRPYQHLQNENPSSSCNAGIFFTLLMFEMVP